MPVESYNEPPRDWQHPKNETQKNEEFMLKVKALVKSREALREENVLLKTKLSSVEADLASKQNALEESEAANAKLKAHVLDLEMTLSESAGGSGAEIRERVDGLEDQYRQAVEFLSKAADQIHQLNTKQASHTYGQKDIGYDRSPEDHRIFEGRKGFIPDLPYDESKRYEDQIYRNLAEENIKSQKELNCMRSDLNDLMCSVNRRLDMISEILYASNRKI